MIQYYFSKTPGDVNEYHDKLTDDIIRKMSAGEEFSFVVTGPDFDAAAEIAKSDGIKIPSQHQRENAPEGALMKVCLNGELFWTKNIAEIAPEGEEKKYIAVVCNELELQDDIGLHSLVMVEPRHIFAIAD